ncbi:unnamed protein product, partial [Staurois parvus]
HAAARSRVSGVPVTASHCCCLHRHTQPCATFRSLTPLLGSILSIGCWQITGLPLLLPAGLNMPWAPVPPPHAACQVHSVSWVPEPPPIAAVLHRHTLPCATFTVSSHCWCVPF